MVSHFSKRQRHGFSFLLVLCLGFAPCRVLAQEQGELDMEARNAIMRALAYFSTPDLALASDAALYHVYLKERYGLPELCSSNAVLSRIKEDRANEPLYMFLRMAEPIPFEIAFVDPEGWINAVTACGMWYDKLPSKDLLMDRITTLDLSDPYCVTHSLWAMSMAHHCFQAVLDTALERRLVNLNMDIISNSRPQWGDVAIEALAFAQYHDPSYIPPPDHIREIISQQNTDGSWSVIAGDRNSHSQHTTILAIWALLQYQPLAWPTRPRDIVVR